MQAKFSIRGGEENAENEIVEQIHYGNRYADRKIVLLQKYLPKSVF